MNYKLCDIIKKLPKAIKDPRRVIELFWRRMFPFGIIPKDSEAYRIGSWSYGKIHRVPITEVFPGIEKVDVIILKAFDRVIGTSLDTQEILILSAIVKFTNGKNICEVGTYDGNTALNFAANTPDDALITTIDLPPDWDGQLENVPSLAINVTDRTKVGLQYKNTQYSRKIIQIFGDSTKINWSKMSTPFDIVFIDGCHYYEYVKKDTKNALKHLKSGGLLIWHDYGMIKDVSQVVDETAERIKVNAIQGTRLAIGFIE